MLVSTERHCVVESYNALERIGLESIVDELNWNIVDLDDTVSSRDTIGLIGFNPTLFGMDGFQNELRKYAHLKLALFCPKGIDLSSVSLPEWVSAVLFRDFEKTEIMSALRLVAAGHALLPRQLGQSNRNQDKHPSFAYDWKLTNRELEVSTALVQGCSNKEIGRSLGIATNTVDVHVSAIRKKLGVRNRTQIAAKMIRTSALT